MAAEITNDIPTEAIDDCKNQARRDGIFAGVSAALVGTILGSTIFRFNRNTTIFCGVLTGVLSGYQFTQAFESSNLARLKAEHAKRQTTAKGDSEFVEE